MIFLSLHYGGPHANPAKRVVWGEGGTTEWSGCPPSGGRSGGEFVPTRRRRRRLKNPDAPAPGFTGVWGRQPPTSTRRVYTGALLAATYSTALTISLNFIFNQGNKFAWAHIKCIGDFPKRFKVGLFIPVLNHRQMCAGNPCKST